MKKLITIIALQLVWGQLFSQKIYTNRYEETKAITVMLKAVIADNMVEEEDTVPDHVTPDFHGLVPIDGPVYNIKIKESPQGPGGISSPAPCLTYQGLNDYETFRTTTPPDVSGSVGPNNVLVTTNNGVKIQDLSNGNTQSLRTLGSFFSPLSATKAYDPKTLYDPYADRWIITCADETNSLQSRLLLAVSQTSNPLGAWHYYVVDVDPANSTWLDYPCIGINKNWIVISGNMFNNGSPPLFPPAFVNNAIFAVNKSAAYAGSLIYTRFSINNTGQTIYPCTTYDNTQNAEWLCNNYNAMQNNAGYLRLYRIDGTPSSPTFTATSFFPSISSTWYSDRQIFNTPTCTGLDIMDSRIRSLVFQVGHLWVVQKIGLPANTPTRASVQWWEINPANGLVTQFGRIDDSFGNNSYFNPSLAVNDNGDVLVGYSHVSNIYIYPTAAYSFRNATDPLGTLQLPYDYKTSTRIDCRQRFGDYSSTVLDPNKFNLWTIQEYFPNGTIAAGSWWSRSCVAPGCAAIRILNTPIATPNIKYEVSDHIIGSSVVSPPNGYVKFDAAGYIELNPGFRTVITTSGFFKAYIDGCGGIEKASNGNIFRTEEIDPVPPDNLLENDIRLSEFKVYPNPANEILYINIPDKDGQILKIELWDAMGRKISVKSNLPYQSSIDIQKIQKGIYFITIWTQKREYRTKFTKQ